MSGTPIWSARRNTSLVRGQALEVRVPVAAGREVEVGLAADNVDSAGLQVRVRPEPGATLLVGADCFLPEEGRRRFSVLNSGQDSFVDVEVRLPAWGPEASELEFRAYER